MKMERMRATYSSARRDDKLNDRILRKLVHAALRQELLRRPAVEDLEEDR